MIIAKLSGGLGNQMFQYAASIQLAHQLNQPCKFDLNWFDEHSSHNGFELTTVFDLDIPIASEKEKEKIFGKYSIIMKLLGNKVYSKKLRFLYPPFLITEKNIQKVFLSQSTLADMYMVGYWQSEKYFFLIKNIIASSYKFTNILNQTTVDWHRIILANHNSISLHVRRGDYITDKKSSVELGVCTSIYYKSAIDLMVEKYHDACFFVFSDDLQWAENMFNFIPKVYFVSGHKSTNSYLDMFLMSQCSHHIIANSSFSWWGAWLAQQDRQTVIAPYPWFNFIVENREIYLQNWVLLDKNTGDNVY